jgi:hypothetical protein
MKLKLAHVIVALVAAAPLFAMPVKAQAPAAGRGPSAAPSAGGTQAQAPASGAPAASATAPAAAQPVDPAKAAAVRQLMDVTGSGKLGEELINLMTSQVRTGVANAIPQSDRLQQFMADFSKNLATRVTPAQIDDSVIPIYAQHLSLEDIQALVAFYQTPSGQHVIKALPLIIQESQTQGANMARPAVMDTLHAMTTQYPDLMQVLPQQGAAAPAQGQAAPQTKAPAPSAPSAPPPSLRQIPSQ